MKFAWEIIPAPAGLRQRVADSLTQATGSYPNSRDTSLLEGNGFREFVLSHTHAEPESVYSGSPKEIATQIENQVNFCVYPTKFRNHSSRLIDGYAQGVRSQKTAALRYEVAGGLLTVMITDELTTPTDTQTSLIGSEKIRYRSIGEKIVPVRRLGNWTYLFTGKFEDKNTLVELAADAFIDWETDFAHETQA